MRIAIVGSEAAKFTPPMRVTARRIIYRILTDGQVDNHETILVSGGCHLGGIDMWAEEYADALGLEKIIHLPAKRQWSGGYRERNLKIVRDCDELHNITVSAYHQAYKGMRFKACYHCYTDRHVKSGGCWTMKKADEAGKPTFLHVITLREPTP